MNGISGKRLLAGRIGRSLVNIETDDNIVITSILGADGSRVNSNGDIVIEVHFDIKAGYRFDHNVTTNSGTFIWDSLNGRFAAIKPNDTLQISVSSIQETIVNMRALTFTFELNGQVHRHTSNAFKITAELGEGERLSNILSSLEDRCDYCLNPLTGEIYLYNIPVPAQLSTPVITVDDTTITIVPSTDWSLVGLILLYDGAKRVWNWRKSDITNYTIDLSTLPDSVLTVGEHNFTLVYSQLASVDEEDKRDDSDNSEVIEYTVSGGNDE